MALDADALCRQPRKLGKSLKKLRQDSSPDLVHKLRTRTRRFEAMVDALELDSRKNERRLIRALKPVRRRAGRVRDMDVLTQFASRPQLQDEGDCSIRLLEHLGSARERQARKLQKRTRLDYVLLRERLRKCAQFLDKTLQARAAGSSPKNSSRSEEWAEKATALALRLEAELRNWRALNQENLHPFRLTVKKLRYVLQMAKKADNDFVDALGEVKDSIGEWHDWQELSGIAKKVIEHSGCKLLQDIDRTAREKFEEALAASNRLRQNYLNRRPQTGRRMKLQRQHATSPAVISASALAA